MDPSILRAEAAFADSEYTSQLDNLVINDVMLRKYSEPRQMFDWRQRAAALMGPLEGKQVLDFGCGIGEEATYFAKLGAHVTAIEISQVGLDITRRRAKHNGLSDRIETVLTDATATPFADETFDIVHGLGILHHVGLEPGLNEVRRVLKHGGTAVFLEPLGNVAFVEQCKEWLYRHMHKRIDLMGLSEDEENLRIRDIVKHTAGFSYSKLYFFRLTYRARKLFAPKSLHGTIERVDWHILNWLPFMRTFAGSVLIHVKK